MKAQGAKKIDYTSITIKLLLTSFHAPKAKVVIDGKEPSFKKAYLASTMYGQYYSGGMQVAPGQTRLYDSLTFVTLYKACRIRALMAFPTIFKGQLGEKAKICKVIKCKEITVTFDRPTALQIDGEVVEDVTTYTVKR